MKTLHGHSKQSSRSGFDHFSADQTSTYDTHTVLDIKTSKPGHHQEGIAITGRASFLSLTKVSGFHTISSHFSSFHRQNSFTVQRSNMLVIMLANTFSFINVSNQTFHNETQACRPRMESLKNFSSYVYMYQSRPLFMQPAWTPARFYINI